MDKTLEIIMVAMTLVVAAVVVVSMLQGQSGDFGDYSETQRDSSQCNMEELRYERALNKDTCSKTGASQSIKEASTCTWADDASPTDYC